MTLNKIKVISSKNDYVIKDGVLFAKPAGVLPAVGKDNRMYLSYDLGIKLVIPNGVIAFVMAPNESSMHSVVQSGNFVLLPGTHEKVSIEYKINTDAIPRVFEKDEICAQIVFLNSTTSTFETIIEEAEKVADPEPVKSIDEEQNQPMTTSEWAGEVDNANGEYTPLNAPNNEVTEDLN